MKKYTFRRWGVRKGSTMVLCKGLSTMSFKKVVKSAQSVKV